jgi:hypothetical protein
MANSEPNDATGFAFLSLPQAAAAAGYKGTEAIRKAIDEGDLRAFKLARLKIVIAKEDLLKWILSKQIPKKEEKPRRARKDENKIEKLLKAAMAGK